MNNVQLTVLINKQLCAQDLLAAMLNLRPRKNFVLQTAIRIARNRDMVKKLPMKTGRLH